MLACRYIWSFLYCLCKSLENYKAIKLNQIFLIARSTNCQQFLSPISFWDWPPGLGFSNKLKMTNLETFKYTAEGVLLVREGTEKALNWLQILFVQILFGCIGLFGNLMCLIVFSQKLTMKCFHYLMLWLAIFDSVYIIMAILLFGIPTVYIE